jgi:predicted NBD/HSP70 family sugar kinase
MQRGCDSLIRRRFGPEPFRITRADVFDCAAGGDALARSIIDRGSRYLDGAIAGLLHVPDSEVIITGGQIAQAGASLPDPIRRAVESEAAWQVGSNFIHRCRGTCRNYRRGITGAARGVERTHRHVVSCTGKHRIVPGCDSTWSTILRGLCFLLSCAGVA